MKKLFIFLCLLFVLCQVWAARKALIIGNGAYDDKALKNAVNDAILVDRTMQSIGFETQLLLNKNSTELHRAIYQFASKLSAKDEVLFYYSGHAIQLGSSNYLLPVKEEILDESSVKTKSIALTEGVMERMERAGFLIIVLDACRDNPFLLTKGGIRGLAVPPSSPQDHYILYSTSANSVALDGTGDNSDFTRILCENITVPGLELTDLGKQVRRDVSYINHEQKPDQYVRYHEKFYFVPEVSGTSGQDVSVASSSPELFDYNPPYISPVDIPEYISNPPPMDFRIRTDDAFSYPDWQVMELEDPLEVEEELFAFDFIHPSDIMPAIPSAPQRPVLQRTDTRSKPFSISFGSLSEAKVLYDFEEMNQDMGVSENYIQLQFWKFWLRQSYDAHYKMRNHPRLKMHVGIPLYLADLEVGFRKDYLPYYCEDYYVEAMLRKSFKVDTMWTSFEAGFYMEQRNYENFSKDFDYNLESFLNFGKVPSIFKTDNRLNNYLDGYGKGMKGQITIGNVQSAEAIPGVKNYLRDSVPLFRQKQGSIALNIACEYEYLDFWINGPPFHYDYYIDRLDIFGNLSAKVLNDTELDLYFKKNEFYYSEFYSRYAHPNHYRHHDLFLFNGFLFGIRLSQGINLSNNFSFIPTCGVFFYDYDEERNDSRFSSYKKRYYPLELNTYIGLLHNLSLEAKLGWRLGEEKVTFATWKDEPLEISLAFAWQYRKSF